MEGFTGKLEFLTAAQRQAVVRNLKEIREPEIDGSSLYVGKRLHELNVILRPFGCFTSALDTLRGCVHMPRTLRTAYFYMCGYRNAAAKLPEGAVNAMMERRLLVSASRPDVIGDWDVALAVVPPPATGNAATYLRWVDEMIEKKPKRLTGPRANQESRDPDEVVLECYRSIERLGKRLPVSARERCVRKLIGYTLSHFGLKPEKFVPVEVPPSFLAPTRRRFRQAEA